MFGSKWKFIGFVVYLAMRLVIGHPIAIATTTARAVVECRSDERR